MIQGDTAELLGVVAANVAVIAVVSVGIGASAPRWPRRWLTYDKGPLRLTRWDTAANYRRVGVPRLARTLPEAGAAFGGVNKRTHPRRSRREINDYLIEARRGEWVHWLAMTAVVPMIWFNPRWMWLTFAVTVVLVNGVFIGILRNSRVRLYAKLATIADQPNQPDQPDQPNQLDQPGLSDQPPPDQPDQPPADQPDQPHPDLPHPDDPKPAEPTDA